MGVDFLGSMHSAEDDSRHHDVSTEDGRSEGVVTLAPDDPVSLAVDHMLTMRLRSLPVVEPRGRTPLVGIVSRGDVLSSLMLESHASHMRAP